MPELPEVELAKRLIEARCVGRRIDAVALHRPSFAHKKSDDLEAELKGATVVGATRHGKSLAVQVERKGDARWWMLHLGMSGKLKWDPVEASTHAAHPHERVTMGFTGGGALRHIDMRMLGYVAVGTKDAMRALSKWDALGPDALAVPTPSALRDALLKKRSRPPIKIALMDQGRIAGLGNIQAAEALFRARTRPDRPIDSLGDDAWGRLFEGIRASIAHTLAHTDAHDVVYVREGAPNPFLIYGREGSPCPQCAQPIERIVQRGRATFFCPRCQT